ncbi:MAG: putative protein disulfide-isomerase [Rhodocyclaceae bacterium]|nr:putative protein disulfide-isomerase [Rhodocyclaceae bacterium]
MLSPRAFLVSLLLAAGTAFAIEPTPGAGSGNWAADAELEGIVDLLDLDYLKHPIRVDRLPLKYAVTTIHGRGERTVYTFEDPNCGYCRQLTRRLEEIGNVTVHTFIVTFLGENSRTQADAVWCARDRSAAWHRVMGKKDTPPAPAGCRGPTAQTMKLVGMLGITLAPTVFFADGSRMNGIKPRDEIEERLQAAARNAGSR